MPEAENNIELKLIWQIGGGKKKDRDDFNLGMMCWRVMFSDILFRS